MATTWRTSGGRPRRRCLPEPTRPDELNPPLPFVPVTPAKRPLLAHAACDGRRMGLATPFLPGIADVMRALGAQWFAPRRMWVCPIGAVRALLTELPQRATRWPDATAEGALDVAMTAWRHPVADYFVQLLDVQLMPLAGGGTALASEYDSTLVSVMRGMGAVFHRQARAWEVRATPATVLRALDADAGIGADFVFIHEGEVQFDKLAASSARASISVGGAAPEPVGGDSGRATDDKGSNAYLSAFGQPLTHLQVDEEALQAAAGRCGLRGYQTDGVRHLLSRSSGLLADDMGLGKTRQAVVAGHLAAGTRQILVVCPASLGINWEREIHAVFPGDSVGLVGEDRQDVLRRSRWIVSNYERLAGIVTDASLRLEVMLVDEAHYLKEPHAGRTRNAVLLAQRIPRVFLLTGTPVLNREVELHTLLRLSGHPLGSLPMADFRRGFAGDAERRDDLARRLSEWMLRRGKDVLTDLGTKTQQVRYVQPAEGLAGYHAIMDDSALQSMPKITKLRQHLEALKIQFLVESVQCLAPDDKALIFCEYMDTVRTLEQAFAAAGIGCVSLVGADARDKRMRAVDAFQQQPQVQVFIGTTMAAGVGLTLTAANYVFFASLPWTPALKRQAEDRAYRSGQRRDVLVIVPLVAGTIDEQICQLLDGKREIELSLVEANRRAVRA